ncbi:hypothetical protein [Telluribacter sp.]|jgi:uncharacterized protein YodC (DUF2158 family)|uniref:hypothetical protein n=1 Tax=Telluribacter sp. TaxID=1978767 RepID=UPI002E0FD41C|nr:hypothetical protein [Telluribacter sp.]
MTQNPENIKIGDLVTVKTGGPTLRVLEINEDGRATCEPMTVNQEKRVGSYEGTTTETYDLSALQKTDQDTSDEGFVDMTGI